MATLYRIFLTIALTVFWGVLYAQVNDAHIRQVVLQKAIIDSNFIFGNWTEKGDTETHLKYLGKVKTKKGQTFKLVNSIWLWGMSCRATARLLIFNEKDRYVGNYYMSDCDLPTSLEKGILVFKNDCGGCDKKLKTIINLKYGLPKEFFRKCNGVYGDIFAFSNE